MPLRLARSLVALACCVSIAQPLAADATATESAPGPATAMERMEPGPEHEVLGEMVGDWTYRMTLYPGHGMEPMVSDGTFTGEWILDGRFVATRWRGEILGVPFEGHSLEGFNRTSGQYESRWVDNQTTSMSQFTGHREGDTIHFHGENWDAMSGSRVRARTESTAQDGVWRMTTWTVADDGSETIQMEIVARRR